jgi:hypothetical protein
MRSWHPLRCPIPALPGPSSDAPGRDRKRPKKILGGEFNAVVASPPLPDPRFAGSLGRRSGAPHGLPRILLFILVYNKRLFHD